MSCKIKWEAIFATNLFNKTFYEIFFLGFLIDHSYLVDNSDYLLITLILMLIT